MHAWLSVPLLVMTTMAPAAQSTDPTVASLKGQFDAGLKAGRLLRLLRRRQSSGGRGALRRRGESGAAPA